MRMPPLHHRHAYDCAVGVAVRVVVLPFIERVRHISYSYNPFMPRLRVRLIRVIRC